MSYLVHNSTVHRDVCYCTSIDYILILIGSVCILYAEFVCLMFFNDAEGLWTIMGTVFNGKSFINILLSNVSETQGSAINVHNCSDHHHHLSPSRLGYMTGGTCSR